ncbi:MAG: tetratricopeptide repeat protein [Candidatus Schekmanbacteria bacterium]|nr:tetratricopeptide repeat protein [Candidatus Schekmanbacteria bacterium]
MTQTAFATFVDARVEQCLRDYATADESQRQQVLRQLSEDLDAQTLLELNDIASEAAAALHPDRDDVDSDYLQTTFVQIGDRQIAISKAKLELWLDGWLEIPEISATPEEIGVLVTQGYTAMNGGDIDGAIDLFQLARALDRRNPGHQFRLGVAYFRDGSFFEAIECFDRMLELVPDDVYGLVNRSEARLAVGDYDGAEADARKLMQLVGSNGGEPGAKARMILRRLHDVAGTSDVEE